MHAAHCKISGNPDARATWQVGGLDIAQDCLETYFLEARR